MCSLSGRYLESRSILGEEITREHAEGCGNHAYTHFKINKMKELSKQKFLENNINDIGILAICSFILSLITMELFLYMLFIN